ncbi:MAG: hypothetical protein KKE44_22210 [Proteobacteria bacterium]|nr:hypothetical protein [Pseudomonadota bacterium]MBU1585450.1 hypothetical protein [Pseudomonadota bacterium]MBU2630014.1 hypothetical protein [Pseudomonadota bacterium]
MPYNFFEKLKKACKDDKDNVSVWKKAKESADDVFKLRTENEIIDFIANDGLENIRDEHVKPLELSKNKENAPMVYSYEFRTMCILGYIAIVDNKKIGTLSIKSFKRSTKSSNTMEVALKIAGLLPEGGDNE